MLNNLERIETAQRVATDRVMVFQFGRRVASCWKSPGGWIAGFTDEPTLTLFDTMADALDWLCERAPAYR